MFPWLDESQRTRMGRADLRLVCVPRTDREMDYGPDALQRGGAVSSWTGDVLLAGGFAEHKFLGSFTAALLVFWEPPHEPVSVKLVSNTPNFGAFLAHGKAGSRVE
jgi:hypothetical protein